MADLPRGQKGDLYCVKVKGVLTEQWADWFGGLSMQTVGDDETWLAGPIVDQAALHGMLAKIRDLGLTLLSVQRVGSGLYRFTTHLGADPVDQLYSPQDEMTLLEGLGNNILQHLGNVELGKSLRVFMREADNRVVGGICGNMFGGWIYISLLWVVEALRKQGYGTELLRRLETLAMQQGCRYAHVDTYSFEARPFYERAGYQVFARLDDYPAGHCKYFLKKTLVDQLSEPPVENAEGI